LGHAHAATGSVTFTTPGGLSYQQTFQRTVTLADGNNLLSLETLTDTVTINGRTYMSVYDASARTELLTTPAGRETGTTLDEQGRITRLRIGNLQPVRFAYDTRGRLVQTAQGSGGGSRVATMGYNDDGYIAQITDPLGQEARFDYDLGGRVTQTTLPGGQVVQFGYDANGNLASITPPERPNHTFTYTAGNLPAEYIPPDIGADAGRLRYRYNDDRQPAQVIRSDGTTIDLGYDNAGRLMTVTLPRGQIGYSYDPATGKLATLTAPDGTSLAFSYDGNLPIEAIWSGTIAGGVGQSYNNDFQIASQSVNGAQTIAFQYDADGLLVQAGNLTLDRDPQNGLMTGSTLGNVSDAVAYNGFGEVNSYQATFNSTNILAIQYTRDALGRIIEKTETLDGTTNIFRYSYDPSGRLVEVRQNGNIIAGYTYDGNGNRLSHTGAAGAVNGVYDAQDRLLQYGNMTYTYTADGELLTKSTNGQTTTYDYDVLGNLMAVALPDGVQIEYIVDGYNRRIGKRVNGTLVQGFLYQDDLNPIAELNENNNVVSRFIYAEQDNVPPYMIKNGETYRILTDHLGSPRLVVHAASGAIAQRMDYDAFGNVLLDTYPGFQPFGFAGGLYDPDTGLTRFGARDYDAEVGRWTAKDPIGFAGGDTNLYAYVGNDPVNLFDPTGTGWFSNTLRAIGVALGIWAGGDQLGAGRAAGDPIPQQPPTQTAPRPAPGGGGGSGGGGGGRGGGGRGGGGSAGCIILFLNFSFCTINPEEPACLRQQGYPQGYGPGA
jgi:RHS repeat-associated protein